MLYYKGEERTMSGSIAKNPPGESGPDFIARKYLEYRRLLDEALEAGALASPNKSESVEPDGKGGFASVINIKFSIMEFKLHQFKTKPR